MKSSKYIGVVLYAVLCLSGSLAQTPHVSSDRFILKGAITMPGDKTYLTILDRTSGVLTQWVPIGAKTADGASVLAFDPKRSVATLKVGEQTIDIPLEAGRIKEGEAPAPKLKGTFKVKFEGHETSIVDELVLGAPNRIYLGDGRTLVATITSISDGPFKGNLKFESTIESVDDGGKVSKLAAPTFMVAGDQDFNLSVDKAVQFGFKR